MFVNLIVPQIFIWTIAVALCFVVLLVARAALGVNWRSLRNLSSFKTANFFFLAFLGLFVTFLPLCGVLYFFVIVYENRFRLQLRRQAQISLLSTVGVLLRLFFSNQEWIVVLSAGQNDYGALGVGDTEMRFHCLLFSLPLTSCTGRWTPTVVLGDLSSMSISLMAGGNSHSLFVLGDGRVLCTGGEIINGEVINLGLLGLGDNVNRKVLPDYISYNPSDRCTPTLISALTSISAVSASAGSSHSLVLGNYSNSRSFR